MKKFICQIILLFIFISKSSFFISAEIPLLTLLPESKDEIVYISYPHPPKTIDFQFLFYISQECSNNNVPYLLVLKLIEKESNWKKNAIGYNFDPFTGELKSTDHGYFQINSLFFEDFIERYKDTDRDSKSYDLIHNIYDNAQIGIRHLSFLYSYFHNWTQAVQAYNAGAYRIETDGPSSLTKEYQEYIVPIENWWNFPPHIKILKETDPVS